MKHFAVVAFLVLALPYFSSAQRLERFGNNGVSYAVIKTLYGIIPTKNIPSAEIKDTLNYFVYLWLPDSVSEISVRLISPVPPNVFPNTEEKITEDFLDPPDTGYHKYFDSEIFFERGYDSPKVPAETNKGPVWEVIAQNDNSSELMAQPSGEKNNSLIHFYADPKKNIRITRGLYRIRFRAASEKNPSGTFMLQVGVPALLPELKLFIKDEEF